MAFELTPQSAGASLFVLLLSYFVAFALQIYMLYLNWRQSQVKGLTAELVSEVKAIRKILEEKKRRK